MASRKLDDLSPAIREKHDLFVFLCNAEGIDVLTYCTFRDGEEQKELYAIGRTKPGKKVTWTLSSKHGHTIKGKPAADAFDCVPLYLGKAMWNDKKTYARMGVIGEHIGLIWGGHFKGVDSPHFEI